MDNNTLRCIHALTDSGLFLLYLQIQDMQLLQRRDDFCENVYSLSLWFAQFSITIVARNQIDELHRVRVVVNLYNPVTVLCHIQISY